MRTSKACLFALLLASTLASGCSSASRAVNPDIAQKEEMIDLIEPKLDVEPISRYYYDASKNIDKISNRDAWLDLRLKSYEVYLFGASASAGLIAQKMGHFQRFIDSLGGALTPAQSQRVAIDQALSRAIQQIPTAGREAQAQMLAALESQIEQSDPSLAQRPDWRLRVAQLRFSAGVLLSASEAASSEMLGAAGERAAALAAEQRGLRPSFVYQAEALAGRSFEKAAQPAKAQDMLDRSIEAYRRAAEIALQRQKPLQQAEMLVKQAEVLAQKGEWSKNAATMGRAAPIYDAAIEVYHRLGNYKAADAVKLTRDKLTAKIERIF